MNIAMRERGEAVIDEAIQALLGLRTKVGGRLDVIDVDDLRKRGEKYANLAVKHGSRYASSVRKEIEGRVRPQPKLRFPLVGALLLGAAAVGIGVLLYDKGRRSAVRGQVGRLQEGARRRYADLGGVGGAVDKVRGNFGSSGSVALDEAALEARVRDAIGDGGEGPAGLKVTVEGRTVYLRGAVEDASAVDAAAERVHAVEGVVAVVNLTTSPARSAAAAPNGGS